jgi:pyrroline-5-carboxylate reductase
MHASRVAIQGAGHLAAALIEGFSRTQTTPIAIYNRTPERALELARVFPEVRVFEEAPFDCEECPLLLVIPGRVLLELPDARMERLRRSGRVIVSCANGLPLSALEKRFPAIPWVKAIPSVAAGVGLSVTLAAKGTMVTENEFRDVVQLFGQVGSVIELSSEQEMDRFAVVTSCLPGILAAMLDEFALMYGLDQSRTRELLIESSLGSIVLAKERTGSLREIASSVSNPGGLTELGVSVIRQKLPAVLAELRQVLDDRQEQRRQQYLAFSGPLNSGPNLP